jgi:hypothetical protein
VFRESKKDKEKKNRISKETNRSLWPVSNGATSGTAQGGQTAWPSRRFLIFVCILINTLIVGVTACAAASEPSSLFGSCDSGAGLGDGLYQSDKPRRRNIEFPLVRTPK